VAGPSRTVSGVSAKENSHPHAIAARRPAGLEGSGGRRLEVLTHRYELVAPIEL
jgi:hypothetical protein